MQRLQQLRDSLRPGQRRMADWQGGALAVSAVPGSGKSTGMAIAAALLLARRYVEQATRSEESREELRETSGEISREASREASVTASSAQAQLILVTFTRSAAANLKAKIRNYLKELSLPTQGFAVYTLHGLALNIANRHPDLSGLNLERMTLVSPTQSNRLLRTCVEQWISANPRLYLRLLEGQQFDGEETERLRRQSVLRTEVLPDLAYTVIHEAKSSGLSPEDLLALNQTVRSQPTLDGTTVDDYEVLAIAAGLYEQYQTLLQTRSFIDYDDMILAALRVLEHDSARQLWQAQVFAVFEDEAQDSSPLQTRLLEVLAAHPTDPTAPLNLVRVGDPNQAINSTFTPADPLFFREFCYRCQQIQCLAEMDQAGRSSTVIMDAANVLLRWVNRHYAPVSSSDAPAAAPPFRPQVIRPVDPGDPQPDANPAPVGQGLEIRFPRDVLHSVELMGQRVAALFKEFPEARAAVLVRENKQGQFIADRLRNPDAYGLSVNLAEQGIEIYEVSQRDRYSHIPAEMLAMLQFLDRPHSPDYLKAAMKVLVDRKLIPTQDLNAIATAPEQVLYPGPLDPPQLDPVLQAQRYGTGLLRARLELPQYQLIPFLAMTLQYDQTELATADKLAARIAQQTTTRPSLTAMLEVLMDIVNAEQFDPVETEDPETRYIRPGQLTLITMHKAKGLDWDFVFIPFLHESMISGRSWVPPQAMFLGNFNLAEVARAQIRAHIHQEGELPDLAIAWDRACYLKVAEEFRLLYVAMTRARRLLWMSAAQKAPFTWNKPENLEDKNPLPILPILSEQFASPLKSRHLS